MFRVTLRVGRGLTASIATPTGNVNPEPTEGMIIMSAVETSIRYQTELSTRAFDSFGHVLRIMERSALNTARASEWMLNRSAKAAGNHTEAAHEMLSAALAELQDLSRIREPIELVNAEIAFAPTRCTVTLLWRVICALI